MSDRCPICTDLGARLQQVARNKSVSISCPRCGEFSLPFEAMSQISNHADTDLKRASMSHQIRCSQRVGKVLNLDISAIRKFAEIELPTVQEQADNLISWLGMKSAEPGSPNVFSLRKIEGVIGSVSNTGAEWVLKQAASRDLIRIEPTISLSETGKHFSASLTYAGWERYEELRNNLLDSRRAFMAMQYGETELDVIVRDFLKPAVRQTGFELHRLDDNPEAGLIDNRMRVEIRRSRFLLADLTHDNHGAYWEAGFAEGLGKPVIYLCKKEIFNKQKTHFDTNHHQCILWEPNKLEDAAEDLKATIRATMPEDAIMEDRAESDKI